MGSLALWLRQLAWNRAGISLDVVETLDSRPASCQCFLVSDAIGRFAGIDQFLLRMPG